MTDQEKVKSLEQEVARLNKMLEAYNNPDITQSRQVWITLLREIPPDTVVVKYMSGNLTAQMVIDSLIDGTEDGLRYMTECLRLVRDILAARSK